MRTPIGKIMAPLPQHGLVYKLQRQARSTTSSGAFTCPSWTAQPQEHPGAQRDGNHAAPLPIRTLDQAIRLIAPSRVITMVQTGRCAGAHERALQRFHVTCPRWVSRRRRGEEDAKHVVGSGDRCSGSGLVWRRRDERWRATCFRPRTSCGRYRRSGNTDGTGAAVRFDEPWGVAVDSAGNVYVTDTVNFTIRKVTAAGW